MNFDGVSHEEIIYFLKNKISNMVGHNFEYKDYVIIWDALDALREEEPRYNTTKE